MKIRASHLAVLAFAMAASAPAFAAKITTLFNTGVDASGTPLANNALDPHYTINGGAPRVATEDNGYPIPPYLGDNGKSAWIGPQNPTLEGYYGYYDYQTTFTLDSNLQAATAAITGRWSTDDYGFYIFLNGVDQGQCCAGDFTNWYNFSVTSGFVTGLNTLDFYVYNTGGPTALRVEMTGSVVPEPASWAMMLGGFGMIGGALRIRRKTAISFG